MKYKSLSPNLGVKNVDETVHVYTTMLDFDLIMTNPKDKPFVWAMVQKGDVTLMFQEQANLLEEYPIIHSYPIGGCITFYIKVKHAEKLYEKIKDKVKVVKNLGKTFYGATEFAIQDNNGYVLAFAEDNE